MDSGMFSNLVWFIKTVTCIAVIGIIGVLGLGIYCLTTHNTIKSKKVLIPEKQLIIKENKIDTLYIYNK